MESIRTYIAHFVRLSEKDWETIKVNFEPVAFKANETVLEIGRISKYFYFHEEGLVRFYLLVDGEDISRAFLPAPCFFTSRKSFMEQVPSREGIHCLEKGNGWRISFTNFQKLSELPTWNKFLIALFNLSHNYLDDYIIDLLSLTAEERYINLLNDPAFDYLHRVPLRYLSSSLGIAPQSLSRIRKKINSKLT